MVRVMKSPGNCIAERHNLPGDCVAATQFHSNRMNRDTATKKNCDSCFPSKYINLRTLM